MRDLPIELLRTFVAVVESGTMAKAARVVGRTPSAVSLQMSKLVELVAKPLFRREHARQGLTAAGETLLSHSRAILAASERAWSELSEEAIQGPVSIGVVQDVADTLLPGALAEFAAMHPDVRLDVHVGTSALLLDEAEAGTLDFVVCFESRRAPRVIRREPLVWLGRRTTAAKDPLPIAILQVQGTCALSEAGLQALKGAGRPHHVVLRTPSLSGLRAALEAGLAVGTRTELLRSGNIELLGDDAGLPPLAPVAFALQVPRPMTPAARRLAALVRGVLAHTECSPQSSRPLTVVAS